MMMPLNEHVVTKNARLRFSYRLPRHVKDVTIAKAGFQSHRRFTPGASSDRTIKGYTSPQPRFVRHFKAHFDC